MTTPTYDDVLDARANARNVEDSYLRGSGWSRVCDLPGCEWLWRKVIDDKEVTLDQGSAIFVQQNTDARAS